MTRFMNKPLMLVLCILMVFSAFVPVLGASPANDYASHWAKDTIQSAITTGLAQGYPDGTFKPDNAVTRAEFFAMVNNAFKFTGTSGTTYTDVSGSAWYAPVISKAKAAGYISGYADGGIHPDASISRQETAVIVRSLNALTPQSTVLAFNDASAVADWSKQAVIAAFEARIMVGYPNGSFKPDAQITRAEALVVLQNCIKYKNDHQAPAAVAVTGITVDQETMTLTAGGKTGTIKAVIAPDNATDKGVNWTSSDKDVATVDERGKVTPLEAGKTTITATSAADSSETATTKVTVLKEGETAETPVVTPPVSTPSVDRVNLRDAGDFVILAKTGISTVPDSEITGDIGVSPIDSTGLTGFSLTADATNLFSVSSQLTGKAYASDFAVPTPANLTAAVSDMETAFTDAAGRAAGYTELHAGDLSGKTLTPGVYKWGTGVLINSDVTLSGGPNDVWIFQIGEGITQANGTRIILTGGAQAKNIFWQAAETVTIGTDAHFEGIVLGQTNITVGTHATVIGRLLAQTAVTLDASTITAP